MTHYKLGKEIAYKPFPTTLKVAIVGAGMSGLYSAWRLKNECGLKDKDFAIFERSNRTGGRLDSDLIEFNNQKKGIDPITGKKRPATITVKEEQGGMRFLFDSMDDLMALFLKLDLQDQLVPFPMNSNGNNRLFFRGEGFSVAQSEKNDYAAWSELYNLAPSEQGLSPSEIVNIVFNRILQVNPQFEERPKVMGPEFWQKFRLDCSWNGKPLNEWGLWDLYSDMGYSQECITMIYRALGFNGTFLSKMNAGVAYQLLKDFPADAKFRTFKEGFSTLPNALVENVGECNIHLQTSIEAIDYDEALKQYKLSYLHIDQNSQEVRNTVYAEKVILGLPRQALEKLFVKSNAFNPKNDDKKDKFDGLWNALQSASNQPLLKINLYYENAWWGKQTSGRPEVEFGPNFADLPTGSVYPFYAVDEELAAELMYEEKEGGKPNDATQANIERIKASKYDKPAALTIYCDYLNINFWSSLQNNGSQPYHHPNESQYIKNVPADVAPASTHVVEQATKFFKDIFSTQYVPAPVLTSARIWEGSVEIGLPISQQFGYGVHQWAVGADDRQVIKDLIEPLPNLYTCGEAFSDYQGWVEGALRSTDLVMEKGFGLAPLNKVFKAENKKTPSEAITEAYCKNATQLINEYVYKDEQVCVNESSVEIECSESTFLTYFDQL